MAWIVICCEKVALLGARQRLSTLKIQSDWSKGSVIFQRIFIFTLEIISSIANDVKDKLIKNKYAM